MRAVDQQHWPTPEELMEYGDGEALPAARREIEAHLAGCAACRSTVDEQHGLSQRMQSWTTGDVPASLQPPARPASWWQGWKWQPRAVMVTFSAAAAILVVISMKVGSVKQRTAIASIPVEESQAKRIDRALLLPEPVVANGHARRGKQKGRRCSGQESV